MWNMHLRVNDDTYWLPVGASVSGATLIRFLQTKSFNQTLKSAELHLNLKIFVKNFKTLDVEFTGRHKHMHYIDINLKEN